MRALVIFSGGQDSTTCLYWAKAKFDDVVAVTFDYKQRHRIEIEQAKIIAKAAEISEHVVLDIGWYNNLAASALTRDVAIEVGKEVPNTMVPGRNMLFLFLAALLAKERFDCRDIVIGVSQTDYSGYPDCRANFLYSCNLTLNLAMDEQFRIHAPLLWLTKAETIKLMAEVNNGDISPYALTHTCYEGQRPPCGKCPACQLRAKGFEEAGMVDPLVAKGRLTD